MCGKGKLISDAGWKLVEYIKYAGSRIDRKTADNRNGYLLFLSPNISNFSVFRMVTTSQNNFIIFLL